jgi:hypothetical protein
MRAFSMTSNICAMPLCTSPTSVPTGRLLLAEGDLAGRRDLQAHLLLDAGDDDAVAGAELAGLEVDVVLGDEEQRQALGARAAAPSTPTGGRARGGRCSPASPTRRW